MDPRDRADAMLARARARRGFVVTPEDAVSPMDAASTLQIPRAVVDAADNLDEDESTSSMPAPPPPAMRAPAAPPAQAVSPVQHGRPMPPTSGPGAPAASGSSGEPATQPLARQALGQPNARQERPENQPHDRQLDGLVPTVQEAPIDRRSLTERLGGE